MQEKLELRKMCCLETIKDKNLKPPVIARRGNTIGYFAVPLKYNPVMYLQGFLNARRIPMTKIASQVRFTNVMTVREASNVCALCGKEKSIISQTTNRHLKYGTTCLIKALLSNEMKGG